MWSNVRFGGNLSSKKLKCHISLMIYCMYHLASPRTRQHAMADNKSVTKAVASFYREDWDTVSLGLPCDPRPNIIPVNFFWVKCVRFDLVMAEISGNFPATSKISDEFPKTSERFPNVAENWMSAVPKTFEYFRSYLKDDNFSVLLFLYRLQNSPYFCAFKYVRTLVWNSSASRA